MLQKITLFQKSTFQPGVDFAGDLVGDAVVGENVGVVVGTLVIGEEVGDREGDEVVGVTVGLEVLGE